MSSARATDDDDDDGDDGDARERSSESDSERDARSVELGTAPLLGTPREDGARDDLDASGRRASAREVVREHGWVLGAFALSLVVTTMSMSVPFPFLSQEFARAGLDATRVGATFAALPFGVLVVSPTIAPRVLWRFEATMVAKYSLLGQAACVLATSAFAGRARWRVWLVCRLFQGFFNALTSVTMLCVVTRAAPDAVAHRERVARSRRGLRDSHRADCRGIFVRHSFVAKVTSDGERRRHFAVNSSSDVRDASTRRSRRPWSNVRALAGGEAELRSRASSADFLGRRLGRTCRVHELRRDSDHSSAISSSNAELFTRYDWLGVLVTRWAVRARDAGRWQ